MLWLDSRMRCSRWEWRTNSRYIVKTCNYLGELWMSISYSHLFTQIWGIFSFFEHSFISCWVHVCSFTELASLTQFTMLELVLPTQQLMLHPMNKIWGHITLYTIHACNIQIPNSSICFSLLILPHISLSYRIALYIHHLTHIQAF